MFRRISAGLLTALLVVPVMGASRMESNSLALQPQSKLWVTGTSTVRGYECSANAFNATIGTTSPQAASAVLAGQKAVTTVEVKVPARQLDCANGTMNEHMLRALRASDHPEITFRLSSYELSGAADATRVRLTGTLNMGGSSKVVTLNANAKDGGNGSLRVIGSHEVRMSEFGLKAPTLMMGTLRVHDGVMVNFDLYLRS